MKARSLARQTITIVLLTQILTTLALGVAALVYERNTRLHAFDVQLQGRSDSLLGAIQDAEDPADNVTVDPAELNLPADNVYAVYDRGGKLLGTSVHAPEELTVRGSDGYRSIRLQGRSYRVYQREAMRIIDRAETQGLGLKRPVTILFAAPDGKVRHEVLEAVRFYLIAVILAGAVTAGVVSILLKDALKPITTLAAAAAQLSHRALIFKPPPAVSRIEELRPLVIALTDMASSLEHAFANEQRFFGDAAHELKTAIAVVRSSVQVLMLKERSPAQYRAGLDRVLEDTARVEKLAAQMLKLTLAEDRSRLQTGRVDLSLAVTQVCSHFQPVAALRGIVVTTRLAPHAHVRLTMEDAHTLISNLLFNAIQHSASESAVELSTAIVEATVHLRIRDTGQGIGEAALPHIFDRFYREDPSRSRETGGTGLGLSICKAIVEAAEGTIQIHSAQGAGTTVLVTFTRN